MKKRNWLNSFFLCRPLVSTTTVAFLLAFCWTLIWFVVLLLLTWITGASTAGGVLIGGLLLSTVAEAIVRVFENSALARKYSHGDMNPADGQRNLWWATSLFFAVIFILIVVFRDSYDPDSDIVFEYALSEGGTLINMVPVWLKLFFSSNFMVVSLVICLGLRTYIYKKDHKSSEWKKCVESNKSLASDPK